MPAGTFISKWNKIPADVKHFITRALAILIAWKILYLVFLFPGRVLDKPLSYAVSKGTVWTLNSFSHGAGYTIKDEKGVVSTDTGPATVPVYNVYFNDRSIVSIEDPCNGLELIILYAGFIVAMPATVRRKIWFIIGGTIAIYIVNVLRCAGVAYALIYYPDQADFAHHYLFTFVVYGLIIALWLIFSRKLSLSDAGGKR